MEIILRILIVAVIGLLAWMIVSRLLRRGRSRGLRERLLVLCRDDVGRVDRLVQLERDRTPGLSEVEAYRRAISRLERDVGR